MKRLLVVVVVAVVVAVLAVVVALVVVVAVSPLSAYEILSAAARKMAPKDNTNNDAFLCLPAPLPPPLLLRLVEFIVIAQVHTRPLHLAARCCAHN